MKDLKSRFESFKNTKIKDKVKFAVCGFYRSTKEVPIETDCVFCRRSLTHWEENDLPFDEHAKRCSECPIFRLDLSENRKRTFQMHKYNNKKQNNLVEEGFFLYPLSSGSMDLFCFKCGFFINQENLNTILAQHKKKCDASSYSPFKTASDLFQAENPPFFLNLISGKYHKELEDTFDITKKKLTSQEKEDLKFLLSLRQTNNPFETTKTVLKESARSLIKKASNTMKKDEQELLKTIGNVQKNK